MIELIYLLAEILSVVICILNICDRKIKINVNLLILLITDVVYIMSINRGVIKKGLVPCICCFIVLYALLELRYKLIDTICICITSFIIIAALQMIIFFPASPLYYFFNEDIFVLFINGVICVLMITTKRLSIYKKLNYLCKVKELKVSLCVGAVVILTGYHLYLIKAENTVRVDSYITCLVLIVITMYLILRWQKTNNEVLLKERQIEVIRKCKSSFEKLIDIARKNQHDLNNHIIAITGMHNSIDTYEELVNEQKKYIGEINSRSKINKVLLGINEPILAGYLFSKLSHIKKFGIEIDHRLCVSSSKIDYISIFDLNEIVGILLDNAVDAVKFDFEINKKVYLDIEETASRLKVCVANPSKYLKEERILELFKSGKSTKGENRGLGLSKIKDYQEHYGFDIFVENKQVESKNWIYFTIIVFKH